MKYTSIIASVVLAVAFTSCGSSSSESTTTPSSSSTTPVTNTDTSKKTPPVQVQPTTVVQPTGTVVTPPVVAKQNLISVPVASKAGLNPEHGQPGHRCDISVGAPLDSKPNQAIQPTLQPSINTAPQKVVTPTASPINIPSASPVATAPGMNPQHGQPGHRCDIAVGAPLNSKPTQ